MSKPGVNTTTEACGVKMLNDTWVIIVTTFQQDTANNFRTMYPKFLQIADYKLEFYKNSRSGRTMYKQVAV